MFLVTKAEASGPAQVRRTNVFIVPLNTGGFHFFSMALADDCDTEKLAEIVQSKVQGANVIRHHGKELAFTLPMEQVSSFPGSMTDIS